MIDKMNTFNKELNLVDQEKSTRLCDEFKNFNYLYFFYNSSNFVIASALILPAISIYGFIAL